MKFRFMQLYPEGGTAYSLSHMLLIPLEKQLNSLGISIPALAKRLGSDDFVMVYTISATRKSDTTIVKGPSFYNKSKRVEYAIFIPYRELADFGERIEYVLGQLAKAIKGILGKYEVDSSGLERYMDNMVALAKSNPGDYQYASTNSAGKK